MRLRNNRQEKAYSYSYTRFKIRDYPRSNRSDSKLYIRKKEKRADININFKLSEMPLVRNVV